MRKIFETLHGSHLFGTATPESDRDVKSVLLPTAEAILLLDEQRISFDQTADRSGLKREAEDNEKVPLKRFFDLVLSGEPNMTDMLFAPESAWLREPDPIWLEILENRRRLLSRNVERYVSFAVQQAERYGVVAERYKAAVEAAAFFADLATAHATEKNPKQGPMRGLDVADEIEAWAKDRPHVEFVDIEMPNRPGRPIRHISVCGRKQPYTLPLREIAKAMQRLTREYRKRAGETAEAGGANWKALSTALRLIGEGRELVTTGRITLPRPEAEFLLAVKLGRVPRETIVSGLQDGLDALAREAAASTLPAEPDRGWANDVLMRVHADLIFDWAARRRVA